LKTEDNKNNNH